MGIVVPGEGILESLAQRPLKPLPGKAGRDIFGLAAARGDDPESTEASAGTRLKVLSVCQSWFALLRSASR